MVACAPGMKPLLEWLVPGRFNTRISGGESGPSSGRSGSSFWKRSLGQGSRFQASGIRSSKLASSVGMGRNKKVDAFERLHDEEIALQTQNTTVTSIGPSGERRHSGTVLFQQSNRDTPMPLPEDQINVATEWMVQEEPSHTVRHS
ncbi:MAG: hypothetical protein MMC23_010063 [Stictis urceolatum]|nr:hypothetical protein [Stictis urceolata]